MYSSDPDGISRELEDTYYAPRCVITHTPEGPSEKIHEVDK